MTVKDIILEAGGLTDAAYPQKIEIARLIYRDTVTSQDVRASEIIRYKRDRRFIISIKKCSIKTL